MLQRRKKNIFMSFRNNPRDEQSVFKEIELNIRRGLNRVSDQRKEHKNKVTKLTKKLNELAIEDMTSIDLSKDFRSYYRTHEYRIRDITYTKKIWKAICGNAHLFKGKIVLDVSCDLGIMSMFSVIAGASHVYAVDTSNILQLTERVIADNKLTHKITVIKGKVADITLPVGQVDIIVSTYFGQSLFCQNRIDQLIDARKKWLKPNGLIFPDRCTYYIAAVNNSIQIDRSNFWQHVHKFDMRPMIQAVNSEPYLQTVNIRQVITNACPIKHLNMYTVEKRDYRRFDSPFCLESGFNSTYVGALFTYFDIEFTEGIHPIKFSIQPGLKNTFWIPMIFFLSINDFIVDDEETFYGVFRFNAISDDFRQIDWNIEIMHDGNHGAFRENWNFQTK